MEPRGTSHLPELLQRSFIKQIQSKILVCSKRVDSGYTTKTDVVFEKIASENYILLIK